MPPPTMVANILSVLLNIQFRVLCPELGFHYSCRRSTDMTVSNLKSWDRVYCSRAQAWGEKMGEGS